MVSNRKARLMFVKRDQPFKVSNRTWLNIWNRSGDVCLFKHKRKPKRRLRVMEIVSQKLVSTTPLDDGAVSMGYIVELKELY